MLLRIAFRNLWVSKVRTALVGGIVFFGAFLLVVGNSILGTIETNMEQSVVNSLSGHFQLTSAKAKDPFEFFSMDSSTKDYGRIEDFAKVRQVVESVDNVKSVVPMGLDYAVVATGNLLDRRLSMLRTALKGNKTAEVTAHRAQVKRMLTILNKEWAAADVLIDPKRQTQLAEDKANLAQATSAAFWTKFETEPDEPLEFLENKIARLMPGEDLVWLQYLGVDVERFRANFDRFEKVDGELIPPGKRGILFSKKFYEEQIKNKTARRLDEVQERLDLGENFAECEDCAEFTKLNMGQAHSILSQLDELAQAAVRAGIGPSIGATEGELLDLLKKFFDMNGDTFAERYKVFYDVIAPRIVLYNVAIGEDFVLTSFGKGGYSRNVPVKVYGTYRFRGLDKSPIAGVFNLIDMTTLRELYGVITPEKLAEIEAIKKQVGVKAVNRDTAEEDLFGGDEGVESKGESGAFDELANANLADARGSYTELIADRVYTQAEIESGLVINAAVTLHDGSKAAETEVAIKAALNAAGLSMNVIPWRDAAGLVGNMILMFMVVLLVASIIFTIVSLIIVNNALTMSTLQRVAEIGTMRAIGASRGFIRSLIGLEAVLLAFLFGGAGILAGVGLIAALSGGIPVSSNFAEFLAGGNKFTPHLSAMALIIAGAFVFISGFGSTIYPTLIATRITPREAMARQD